MTNTLERKVYNGWAFTENEIEKGNTNYSIYKAIQQKHKILKVSSLENVKKTEIDKADIVIVRYAKYHRSEYSIFKNNTNLTDDEILLVCDSGNLCFGGSKMSDDYYQVFED